MSRQAKNIHEFEAQQVEQPDFDYTPNDEGFKDSMRQRVKELFAKEPARPIVVNGCGNTKPTVNK